MGQKWIFILAEKKKPRGNIVQQIFKKRTMGLSIYDVHTEGESGSEKKGIKYGRMWMLKGGGWVVK